MTDQAADEIFYLEVEPHRTLCMENEPDGTTFYLSVAHEDEPTVSAAISLTLTREQAEALAMRLQKQLQATQK